MIGWLDLYFLAWHGMDLPRTDTAWAFYLSLSLFSHCSHRIVAHLAHNERTLPITTTLFMTLSLQPRLPLTHAHAQY